MNAATTQERTIATLAEWLRYDPDTGALVWAKKPCIAVAAGAPAGANHEGYVRVRVAGAQYLAHRIAWAMHTGAWPKGDIDHINGKRDDNRIANLRDVPRAVNRQNVLRARADNRVGLIGVKASRNGTYEARIGVNGKYLHLGTYRTAEAAHAAYVSAKRQHHIGNTL